MIFKRKTGSLMRSLREEIMRNKMHYVKATGLHCHEWCTDNKGVITLNYITPDTSKVNSMKCPICNKRAFDIKSGKGLDIEIQLKCPHCHKIVTIAISNQN